MRSLPVKAQVYILVLVLATALVVGYSVLSIDFSVLVILEIVIFSFSICLADYYPIVLPEEAEMEVTVSCALKAAAAIAFGLPITILTTLLGTILAEYMLRRAWYKAVFNVAEMTLTVAAMAVTYELFYDGVRTPFHSVQNALGVLGVLLAYYFVNTGLVTAVLSLTTEAGFIYIWKMNFRDSIWNHLTLIPLGAVAAAMWLYRPWSIFALVLPTVVVRQSTQFIVDLQRQTKESLISMADAIDQRDPSTYQHSRRVAAMAQAIAREMGLSVEETETIRMAARLHDVGKIGMSNSLLYKPDAFTEKEQAEFRRHPRIGAELVRSFRLFYQGQNLILYHHERYDGRGYPDGLAADNIPLGSRILAVADSLDAMTAQRVYKAPLTLPQAVAELERNRGTQFDPDVVNAFQQTLQRWDGKLPWQNGQDNGHEDNGHETA